MKLGVKSFDPHEFCLSNKFGGLSSQFMFGDLSLGVGGGVARFIKSNLKVFISLVLDCRFSSCLIRN